MVFDLKSHISKKLEERIVNMGGEIKA